MKNRQYTNNYSLNTNPAAILKNGLQDINRPNLYLRNVPGIVFAIVFVTRFYIYPESFIPKYCWWFIKEKPFSWITTMSHDSNN